MAKTSSTKNGVARPVEVASTSPGKAVSVEATRPAPQSSPVPARTPAGAQAPAKAPIRPTPEQVGRRAYEIYLDRCQGGKPGTPQGDWAQAEAELNRG